MSEKPLSIAEVCEIPIEGWINGGFTAVVAEIKQQVSRKTNKPFWPCKLRDTTGSATVEMTVFTAPKFTTGDQIDVLGQGIKRGEYNGKPQVSIGQKTEIHIVGKSVHHEEQQQRAVAGEPAINGALQPVAGQSVGMALKEALTALVPGNSARMNTSGFWLEVHQFASDVIRVARQLEAGKLAPSVKERTAPKQEAAAPVRTPSPRPTERQMANQSEGPDDDQIPF